MAAAAVLEMSSDPPLEDGTKQPKKVTAIWKDILKEASRSTQADNATVLCLGRPSVGKRSLLKALKSIIPADKGSEELYSDTAGVVAVDYSYLNVKNLADRDQDVVSRANVWMLDDARHTQMLAKRLKADDLRRGLIMICLDLREPWTIMEDFRQWVELAQEVIIPLFSSLAMEEQDKLRNRVASYINAFEKWSKRPKEEIDIEGGIYKAAVSRKPPGLVKEVTQAEQTSFSVNLGVPMIVVVTRSDAVNLLTSRTSSFGHAELVQAHLRSACLQYGAGLVYTSTKDPKSPKNAEVLYTYMMHMLYDFDFSSSINSTANETIFIPAGGNVEEEINKLAEKVVPEGLQRPFESIVTQPHTKQKAAEKEAVTEVETINEFLAKAMHQMKAGGAVGAQSMRLTGAQFSGAKGAAPKSIPPGSFAAATGQAPPKPPAAPVAAPAPGAAGAAAPEKESLANFFQTLLEKDPEEEGAEKKEADAAPAAAETPAAEAPAAEK